MPVRHNRGWILSAALAASLLSAFGLSAGDWIGFRGPSGLGAATVANLPVEWSRDSGVLWTAEIGPGGSSPTLFGDSIYITAYRGYAEPGQPGRMEDLERRLIRLDRTTGRERWAVSTKAQLPEEESIRDEHGYATSTPAVDSDAVYVFYGKSGVRAFSHAGAELWQADVGNGLNGWGSAASPVLFEDLVIINASVESESLRALDRRTGEERWRAGEIRESWNTPIVIQSPEGRAELVVAVVGKILAFDPRTGQPLWSCDTDIGWYMAPGLVAAEGVVYCIGGRSGGALAVRAGGSGDVTRTHRVWTGTKGSNVSSPLIHEGHLYWAHDQLGIAYCAEAATGRIVYEQRLPRAGQVYPSPVLGDGRIYFTSRSGTTFVIPAAPRFELLAANSLEDRSLFHASPALEDGRIYIRSDRTLYCIGRE
ncbi:MAG: PQQ-binding-like beta-propeller repeat protein [Planctomyces sp.]|nr:PQQ-binding-like beta-propeller repeat protein [Planctomyces sp.]